MYADLATVDTVARRRVRPLGKRGKSSGSGMGALYVPTLHSVPVAMCPELLALGAFFSAAFTWLQCFAQIFRET